MQSASSGDHSAAPRNRPVQRPNVPARCSDRRREHAPADRLRPLRRTRQFREFTAEPVDRAALDAIADVARWSGSSREQPAVAVHRDHRRGRAAASLDDRHAADPIASRRPARRSRSCCRPTTSHEIGNAYDEGRAAERILVAAGMLDLGAGIAWVQVGRPRRSRRDPRRARGPFHPDDRRPRPSRPRRRAGRNQPPAAPVCRAKKRCSRSAGRTAATPESGCAPADSDRGRVQPRATLR